MLLLNIISERKRKFVGFFIRVSIMYTHKMQLHGLNGSCGKSTIFIKS